MPHSGVQCTNKDRPQMMISLAVKAGAKQSFFFLFGDNTLAWLLVAGGYQSLLHFLDLHGIPWQPSVPDGHIQHPAKDAQFSVYRRDGPLLGLYDGSVLFVKDNGDR